MTDNTKPKPEKLLLTVGSSPHIRSDEDTRSIMLDVVIALLPALAISIYFFGWRTLVATVVSVAACIAFELLYQLLMKKPVRIGDLSAVVTGILLAFNLPASVPYWMLVIGAFFAIVIVKELFGGIGKNFMNPALVARFFLTSWATLMSSYPAPTLSFTSSNLPVFGDVPLINGIPDMVTTATPLASLKQGLLPHVSLFDLGMGNIGGAMGEVSAFMLLLGGLYLVLRKVITPRIPVAFIGTVALLTFIFPQGGNSGLEWMLYSILSGGLMLGAIFMATDYTTSPTTVRGQWIFGIGCGLLTVFIRYFGAYPEGVGYSILIMNTCVWLIDKYTRPKRFGDSRRAKKQAKTVTDAIAAKKEGVNAACAKG